ncbi:hypothetical protein ACIPY2_20160 [Paenarthrobacter sp. NPDC089675]|uniref:hypothetical protein n=1 Tax=Paenarthrobacter sp. NPDC089675 TaxID=3364376 RepID=UPI0038229589
MEQHPLTLATGAAAVAPENVLLDAALAREIMASMERELAVSRPIVLPMLEAGIRW